MTGKRRYVGRAPGRLDLMGGNGNYSGGMVFQATTAEGTWATVKLREDRQILFFNPEVRDIGWEDQVEYSLDDLSSGEPVRQAVEAAPGVRWTAYVLGALYLLKQWFPERVTRGANIHIRSEIPIDKSVGSSAALEAAVMKAAAFAYGVELAGIELAAACQWVESITAGPAGANVDPIVVALGEQGCLLPVVCQPCLPQPLVRLRDDLAVWGMHSGGQGTGGAEQEAARVATFMGYKLICDWEGLPVKLDEQSQTPRWIDSRWNGYLANIQPSLFRSNYEQRLPEALSGAEYLQLGQTHVDPFTQVRPEAIYRVRACARHAVEENLRVRLFVELARAGAGFEHMGELMYQSHYSYTECGLGCESTDLLVSLVCEEGLASGLYGAKISAGGAVVILGNKDATDALFRVVERFAETHGEAPYLFAGSSMGADAFGVLTLEG